MAVITEFIKLSTKGNADVHDITPQVNTLLKGLDIQSGIVNINV